MQYDRPNDLRSSNEFFGVKTPWSAEDIAGKLVLDCGCGGGRYMDVVRKNAKEIIGIDLSDAVYSAYDNIGTNKNMHIVQGSLFELSFKDGVFDIAYSIGVLQHTGNGAKAFAEISKAIKSGGAFSIWVYEYSNFTAMKDLFFRVPLRKLPNCLLYLFCYLTHFLYLLTFIPFVGRVVRLFSPPFNFNTDKDWRFLDTYDWISPTYQALYKWPEVFSWFKNNGFRNIEIKDPGITAFGEKQ